MRAQNINYIRCINVPIDIDETVFLVDPKIIPGTKLASLRDSLNYSLLKEMIEAFRATMRGCDEVGNYGLASYTWQSANDDSTGISSVSLVKDFIANANWSNRRLADNGPDFLRKGQEMERYICGTGPLLEESTIESLQLNIEETVMEDIQLEFEEVITEETYPTKESPPLEEIKPNIKGTVVEETFSESSKVKEIVPEKEVEITFMEDTGVSQEEVDMLEKSASLVTETSTGFKLKNAVPSFCSLLLCITFGVFIT